MLPALHLHPGGWLPGTVARRLYSYAMFADPVRRAQVLSHPMWGTRIYPATLVTSAPRALLEDCLRPAREEGDEGDGDGAPITAADPL